MNPKRMCSLVISLAISAIPAAAHAKIDFETEVAPILRQHCVDCHGPALQMADLRLDERKYVLVEGQDRGLIQPGRSGESLLIQRLADKSLGLIMPPTFPFFPEDKLGLPERQIQTLKQWVDEGADWPTGVALAPASTAEANPKTTALFAALRAADHKSVAKLLADRSLANTVDAHGTTPLMYATLYGDLALMQLLIDRGAAVNAADKTGATALMWAAGDLGKVRLLVEQGAKIDVRSQMGRTPLLLATTFPGNAETVRFLLKLGANINDRDMFGETALTSASKRGDAELVETLIIAGADVLGGGGFLSRSPLVWATEEANLETTACLLKHGAAKDPKSLNTALFNACVRGPIGAVRMLLEQGANPSNPSGFAAYTPLMGAAYSESCDIEIIKLLLARGVNVNAQAANGDTALQLAAKRGHTEITVLLEKAGAKLVAAHSPTADKNQAADRNKPAEENIPADVRAAVEKSLALLQKCGPEFFRKSGCVACHQQSVTSLALAEARTRGFRVDEAIARQQTQVVALTVRSFRDRFLQRVDHPANSAPGTGYILMGLAAENYPADEYTDANVIEMANRQLIDGSWTAFGHRPPLEYSRISATALAVRALKLYGPPGLKENFAQRVNLARSFLIEARPDSNSDQAFRLLGLVWSGAGEKLVKEQAAQLVAAQRPDGGWAQLEKLASDAYATGLTLYAMHQSGGLAASNPVYRRGVSYLLSTQLPDGSWHVKSRSFPFQPYFESGFPHGPDQWISASATGFAAAALIDSQTPAASASN